MFSGIGAFEKALDNLNVDYNLIKWCENDKYVSTAYSTIHNESKNKNLGDIKNAEVNKINDIDLITWGFPCQNFSVANRNGQKGLKGDYSGLYYDGLKIVQKIKPKYSIIENVNSLKGEELEVILKDLKQCGYKNYYQVLDSQDYGVPQRRKRLFIISIKQNLNQSFSFPQKEKLHKGLEQYLQDEVRDKYYKVNESIIDRVKNKKIITGNNDKVICNTIIKALPRQGSSGEFILNCALIYHLTGEIRRMTPLETWRLMGFDDADYFNAKQALEKVHYNGRDMSDTRMYNMSANSIVVDVLEPILESLLKQY